MIIQLTLSALFALFAVNWVYFKILWIAKTKNITDNPNARKLQKAPVPILGGISVFFGVVSGLLCGVALSSLSGGLSLFALFPVLCAMVVMLYTGAIDDISGLSVRSRFLIEVLTLLALIFSGTGCVDNFNGLWGIWRLSWWIAVPLTVFAGVGIINAINMIDGVNGLSSGLCILSSTIFGVAFIKAGDWANALLAFVMVASLLPFLLHNVFGKKSRMFIGDAGTMMMGMLMSYFTISVLNEDSQKETVNLIAMSLAILSVPVFDTVRVIVFRIMNGKNPSSPDKNHLHHILVRIGVSHSVTALFEILLDLIMVIIWVVSVRLGASVDLQLYIVTFFGILLIWGPFFFLRRQEKKHTPLMHLLSHASIRSHLGHKEWWLKIQKHLDAPEGRYTGKAETYAYLTRQPNEYYHMDRIEPDNYKAQDRKKLYDYLAGKAEVHIDDVKRQSGVDPMRVNSLIYEGIFDGFIVAVKESSWGAPEIVALKSEL